MGFWQNSYERSDSGVKYGNMLHLAESCLVWVFGREMMMGLIEDGGVGLMGLLAELFQV